MKLSEILLIFLDVRNCVKLYHFQTELYSTHKISDSFLTNFDSLFDKFMEVLQGKTNTRISFEKNTDITIRNMKKNKDILDVIDAFQEIIQSANFEKGLSTDLLNIRDEILSEINQFKYLLSFK
jgi:uncharacterized protein YdcH (DUF465 family)